MCFKSWNEIISSGSGEAWKFSLILKYPHANTLKLNNFYVCLFPPRQRRDESPRSQNGDNDVRLKHALS